jgi:hypothetical protein
MKILSFDIGIKNLAGCIMEKEGESYVIHWWDVLNLLQAEEKSCSFVKKFKNGNSQCCKKKPEFEYNKQFYCKTHIEEMQSNYYLNTNKELFCTHEPCKKKAKWSSLDNQFHLCQVHFNQYTKKKKLPKRNCNTIKIEEIMLCMWKVLDSNSHLLEVDEVIIENQPAKKNKTMKAVADSVFNYFLCRGIIDKERTKSTITKVSYISPSNKLKCNESNTNEVLSGKNSSEKYRLRKKLGIEYCREILKDNKEKIDYFNSHGKKDDLADSFLQGVYYL